MVCTNQLRDYSGSLPIGGSDVSTRDFGTIENWLQSFPLINHPKCGVEAKKRTTAVYQVRIGLDHWHVIWAMPALKVLCWMERLLECVSSHSQAFDLTHVWYLQLRYLEWFVHVASKNRVPLNQSTCTLFSRAQMMVHFHVQWYPQFFRCQLLFEWHSATRNRNLYELCRAKWRWQNVLRHRRIPPWTVGQSSNEKMRTKSHQRIRVDNSHWQKYIFIYGSWIIIPDHNSGIIILDPLRILYGSFMDHIPIPLRCN